MPAPCPRRPARHRRMSAHGRGRALLVVLTVLLTAGCGALHDVAPVGTGQPPPVPTGTTRSSQSPASLVAETTHRVTGSSQPGLTAPPALGGLVPARYPNGPEHAAAAIILDGLANEGLLVTAIDAELLEGTDDRATVAVNVAHSPGHGHPTQSRYELDLTRTTDGWTLAGHREQR